MMSIFSPRSSETTMRTREPRGPTHAPTGSTPSACETNAVAVLLEHHVPLRLADALEDHLLGGLRGDATEVVRRDVAGLDLVLELGQAGRVDVGRLGDDDLAGLRVDAALLERGGLLGLVEQLLLEVGREDQFVHP